MPRRFVDLGGHDWQLGQAPPSSDPRTASWQELAHIARWLPASVPGNVQADLMRAGLLPDLGLGHSGRPAAWVDRSHWWLVRDFALPVPPKDRVHLLLQGVDYIADLFLNGHPLGRHEGMFSPWLVEVTGLLQPHNRLAVRFLGSHWLPQDRSTPWEKLLNHVEARTGSLPGAFPHRRDTLKCQMSFGWDFAPPVLPVGLWDGVCAVASDNAFIHHVFAWPQVHDHGASFEIALDLSVLRPVRGTLRCTLSGATFESDPQSVETAVDLPEGHSHHAVHLPVAGPRLWWPWEHGRPDLYHLSVEVWSAGQLLDSVDETVGLRHVELDGLTIRVNGRRVFGRGANWVPAGLLPGCVAEADYATLLDLARNANMNLLRVWGGGLREKRSFYDLCDRHGILIWQEFPFACAFLTRYPRTAEYLDLVRAEAQGIVRSVRNHPCLAVWCGGNEFDPKRNAPLVEALCRVASTEDPGRPFLPASPFGGDHHNWRVWHRFQPPSAYRKDDASFASEFGLQAPPALSSVRRFLRAADIWPPAAAWVHHGAGLAKLRRYARPFLGQQTATLETFVHACQQAQAHGLQIAIEHFRRRKSAGCAGALVWQLNDPWPAISWSLADFYGEPKPAYRVVQRLFRPVLVSLDYPAAHYRPGERFLADVWIVNDLAEAFCGCRLELALWPESGTPAARCTQRVDVLPDTATLVHRLAWTLPPAASWRITCRLSHAGRDLAENEYDLGAHDDLEPSLGQRLHAWLSDRVRTA